MARPQKFRLSPDDVLDPQNARKLAGHVAEIELWREQIKTLQDNIAEVYDAADEDGFDNKFIRKVVAIRAKDETTRKVEEHGIDAYNQALEIGFRSRARVENPEHDPETGEVFDDHSPDLGKMVAPDPRHGAGGAEDEAAVATVAAPSSANSSTDAGKPVDEKHSGPTNAARVRHDRQPDESQVGRPQSATLQSETSIRASTSGADTASVDAHSEPAEGTTPTSTADGDRSAVSSLAAAPVVPSNVTTFRTHNPETHFLNSEGLPRLKGCQKGEMCGSAEPRKRLCFPCSVAHDGPTPQVEVAR